MSLLDTNVVSELRRASRADCRVAAWADSVPIEEMWLSCISILELDTGVLLLSRRDAAQGALIGEWIDGHVLRAFAGRILPVDTAVARRCATLQVPTTRPYRDSLIAATALVHGLTVVTRNEADFAAMVPVIMNPRQWQVPGTAAEH